MPTWVSNGLVNGRRARQEARVVSRNIAARTTTVAVDLFLDSISGATLTNVSFSGYLFADSAPMGSNTVNVSVGAGGSVWVAGMQYTVTHGADGRRTYRSDANLVANEITSLNVWAGGDWVLDPIPVRPAGLTVSRVSDVQHALSWSVSGAQTVVQRATDGGAWVEVGRPSGATAWTDSSTQPNRRYDYRVANVTSVGQSEWSATVTVYTTPAPVVSVSAEKVGTDVRVTVAGLPPYATAYDVYDGATLVGADVLAFPWTHVGPSSLVTHQYTVRSKRGALVSGHSVPSNVVQLIARPNPPAGLSPNGGLVAAGESSIWLWRHNPVDSSAQSSRHVQYRFPDDDDVWMDFVSGVSSVQQVTVPALTAGRVEWRVRTKGAHPDWSDWSAVAGFEVVSRPGVAVTAPTGTHDQPVLTVAWSYLQAQSRPQSGWRVELLDAAGARVEFMEGSGAQAVYSLATRLAHGDAYTVRVWAATGAVWSAAAVQSFTVVFDSPALPVVSGVWDEGRGVVELSAAVQAVQMPSITNYAPSFHGPTTPVEVRRNLATDPLMANPAALTLNRVSVSVSAGVVTATVTEVGFIPRVRVPNVTPISPGSVVRVALDVPLTQGNWIIARVAFSGAGGVSTGVSEISVSNVPGRLVSTSSAAPAGTTNFTVEIGVASNTPVGAQFAFSKPTFEVNPITGGGSFFANGVASPDSDLSAELVPSGGGAARLMGRHLAALTDNNCISFLTADNSEIRVLSTGANIDSYVYFTPHAAVQPGGVFAGTIRLESPISGTTFGDRARALMVNTPIQISNQAANVAGSTPIALHFSALTSAPRARLYHGGAIGSGEVRWSAVGLMPPGYTGPVIDGSQEWVTIDGIVYHVKIVSGYAVASTPPPIIAVTIERSIDSGASWRLIADRVTPTAEAVHVTDAMARSNGVTLYRVTGWTAAGAASTTVYEMVTDSGAVWLSTGPGFTDIVRLPYNPVIEVEAGRARAVHEYAGRAKPVAYAGEQLSRVVKMSGNTADTDLTVAETSATMRDLERVAMSPTPLHMHRDPDGRLIIGSLSTIPQPRQHAVGIWGYSYTLTETSE